VKRRNKHVDLRLYAAGETPPLVDSEAMLQFDVFREKQESGADFHLTDDMSQTAIGPIAESPHRHPFYEIIYVRSMRGKHILDGEVFENISESLFFLTPGMAHRWENVSEITGLLLYFNEDFFSGTGAGAVSERELFHAVSTRGAVAIDGIGGDGEGIRSTLSLMRSEFSASRDFYLTILRSLLTMLILRVYRVGSDSDSERNRAFYPGYADAFRKMLTGTLREQHSIQWYAAALGVSTGYLSRRVKDETGFTPGEIRRDAMVGEAKRLLSNTDMNISEVAEHLGFSDDAYFCRFFKKACGIQPGKFKQSHIGGR